ncbi:MAG TPA: hypothetical protein VGB42_07285 [Candidatus Thermoplasmatota archaeon]
MVSLLCRDCPHWYGSEDDGYGPCTVKSQRQARRPLTYGGHTCDEGYDLLAGAVMYVGGADGGRAAPAVARAGGTPPEPASAGARGARSRRRTARSRGAPAKRPRRPRAGRKR